MSASLTTVLVTTATTATAAFTAPLSLTTITSVTIKHKPALPSAVPQAYPGAGGSRMAAVNDKTWCLAAVAEPERKAVRVDGAGARAVQRGLRRQRQ
ncbi:hypothetical protein NDU88_000281 [Pleurodeles waltl]|uniref:Secreted protein n=1 Tax=Pleurodeles waltl TaxID=8319 RepID=A0AAV7MGG3_PLEWA|nr:hypothetical protein NDU88_000281 [Pleurodeles waltl]